LWVAFAYAHAYCYSYAYGNCHSDRHSHSHADGLTNTDPVRRKMHSHAAASPNSSASPIAPVAASLCEAENLRRL
jgi:hypothetical protein